MSLKGLLRTTVEIHRPTTQVSQTGEASVSYAKVATVGATIEQEQGGSSRVEAGVEITIDAKGFFLQETDIRPADKIKAVDVWYKVVFVKTPPHRGAPVTAELTLDGGAV